MLISKSINMKKKQKKVGHESDPTIKVTFLGKGWGVRLYKPDGTLWWDEGFVYSRLDIGNVCRDILRWYEKCGPGSPYSEKSRHRRGLKDIRKRIKDEENNMNI
jgi:hypothetical protein